MKDYFASVTTAGIYKEMPDFPFLIIGNIIMGFLYTIVICSWAKATTPGDGAKKGFVFALLFRLGYDLIMYSTANIMTMQGLCGDLAVTVIMGTVVGAVVKMVAGTKSSA